MTKLFTAQCTGYSDDALPELIENYLKSEKGRLARAKRILIKPNLLSASFPEAAVTTNPVFVDHVIKSLKKYTEAELWLGDSPGANFGKYDRVLDMTGIGQVAQDNSLKVVRVESFEPVEKDGFIYSSLAEEVDLIINLPKLKTHSLTGMTLAVKNLFGLIPGTMKVGYHRDYPVDRDLGAKIYKLFSVFDGKVLNILDGITGMEGDGPSKGTPVQLGIAAACSDAVMLDIGVTRMLGLKDDFCLTSRAAIENGYNIDDIKVPETNVALVKLPMSKRMYLPPVIKKLVANQVYVKPYVLNDKCINCMLCMKSCPVDAISVTDKFPLVDNKKCIECFCCHEVCESDAIEMRRSWLHKIMVSR